MSAAQGPCPRSRASISPRGTNVSRAHKYARVVSRKSFPDARTPFGVEHEEGLIRFIDPARKGRFKETLRKVAAGRPRGNVTGVARYSINHFDGWDVRYASLADSPPAEIERVLRAKGAQESCWVISENPDLDGVQLMLRDAVQQVSDPDSWEASVISCIPGRLAYYHDNDDGSYLILERAAEAS